MGKRGNRAKDDNRMFMVIPKAKHYKTKITEMKSCRHCHKPFLASMDDRMCCEKCKRSKSKRR